MFLLPSVVIGIGFALLLGGRLERLGAVRFRLAATVPIALLLQIVLFSKAGAGIPTPLAAALHLGSYALLATFALMNLRLRALVPALLGMALNAIVIAANGGRMPLDTDAARAAGVDATAYSNVSQSAERLRFLGDVFAVPSPLPLANAFSVGDILIGAGIAIFIVVVSLDGDGDRRLEAARMLRPLSVRPYRLLLAGRLVSHVGDWLTLAALVGWIYQTTGSTEHVVGIMLARLAPPILGASVAGLVVDRLPKGRLLVWIELGRGVVVMAALVGVVLASPPLVLAALACSGALAAIANAATSALVPVLLPADQLAPANAALGIAKDAAMALGAVGAGVALSSLGAVAALGADAVTFAVAAGTFLCLRVDPPRLPSPEVRERLGAGLWYLLRRRRLLLIVFSFSAATVATGLANATLPRFLSGAHGLGSGGYGYGIAALAAGLACGEALVGLAHVGRDAGRWIGIGLLTMSGLFVMLGLTDHAPTALLLLAAIGFVDGTTDVLFSTIVQREAEPRYHGAAFGFSSALMTTTMMAAFAAAPLANSLVSPGTVMLGGSVFLLLASAIALASMHRPRAAAAAAVPA